MNSLSPHTKRRSTENPHVLSKTSRAGSFNCKEPTFASFSLLRLSFTLDWKRKQMIDRLTRQESYRKRWSFKQDDWWLIPEKLVEQKWDTSLIYKQYKNAEMYIYIPLCPGLSVMLLPMLTCTPALVPLVWKEEQGLCKE